MSRVEIVRRVREPSDRRATRVPLSFPAAFINARIYSKAPKNEKSLDFTPTFQRDLLLYPQLAYSARGGRRGRGRSRLGPQLRGVHLRRRGRYDRALFSKRKETSLDIAEQKTATKLRAERAAERRKEKRANAWLPPELVVLFKAPAQRH